MHVKGVESTTASMIAVLRPGGDSEVWALTGSPCEHEYTRFGLRGGTAGVGG